MTKQPATPETDAVWGDKSQNILEHARRLERELAAERALAEYGRRVWSNLSSNN